MPKTEERWYIVPEIEVRVHESWINLIKYCQENIPYGDLKIEVNNGQPSRRLKETPSIRFDKQPSTPVKNGVYYLIQSLDMRIHEHWINLINWVQRYFQSGMLEFRLVGGQPTELLSGKQRVDFSKPETIPSGMPLEFVKN